MPVDQNYPANQPLESEVSVCSDGDNSGHSGNIDREYTGVFEGPEKTLEVMFREIGGVECSQTLATAQEGERTGLRSLPRRDLDKICQRARCSILSSISNKYVDAYVLSESSLFVYPHMVILKTCGTTTLLRCIAMLIELGRKLGLEIDWLGYSRKNFSFPGKQVWPHQSFDQELAYLYEHRNLCKRLDGNGYTLGPVTGHHWFVFVADHTRRGNPDLDTDRVLNIMMFDIDEEVANLFYYNEYEAALPGESKEEETLRISRQQTTRSGIDLLCPGSIIDSRAFEPCGYSMNAISFRSYSTIHITPEAGSSYVSFETNQKLPSYTNLITNVVTTFRPKRLVMTLMADEAGLHQMNDNPLSSSAASAKISVNVPKGNGSTLLSYKRSTLASIKVEDDCCCMMGNWVMENQHHGEQQ